MRVLITGARGQLGYDLLRVFAGSDHEAVGVDMAEMDITDLQAVTNVMTASGVDAVIHCAAYTQVDKAEDEPLLCENVNVLGTENIAQVCRQLELPMMYISTDYVFDGGGERPWEPDDRRRPINVYGETKYRGELAVEQLQKHFIVRISWVFGVNGSNFIKNMLKLARTGKALAVVDDQIGSPTYTYDLAMLLVRMIGTEKYGTYHVTNEGECSWYELACETFRQAGLTVCAAPVGSSQYPTRATRPKNSRMSKRKLDEAGFARLPRWQDAVKRYLEELEQWEKSK